ncbi:MAG TPA: hypothetical protein VN414_05120 [Methanosarcina sp.]|nr:hypothetical protein [Methanosarcina sp.]
MTASLFKKGLSENPWQRQGLMRTLAPNPIGVINRRNGCGSTVLINRRNGCDSTVYKTFYKKG